MVMLWSPMLFRYSWYSLSTTLFPQTSLHPIPLCPILPKVKMWLKTLQLQHFNERTTLLNPTKWRANSIVVGAVLFQEYQLSSEPRGRHKSTWRPHLITMTQLRGETDSLIWGPASVCLSGHWWGLMRISIGAEWVLTKMWGNLKPVDFNSCCSFCKSP